MLTRWGAHSSRAAVHHGWLRRLSAGARVLDDTAWSRAAGAGHSVPAPAAGAHSQLDRPQAARREGAAARHHTGQAGVSRWTGIGVSIRTRSQGRFRRDHGSAPDRGRGTVLAEALLEGNDVFLARGI